MLNRYDETTKIWLDYYHELTGNDGAPGYDENGSLFHWIVKHEPNNQTDILHMCYDAGYWNGYAECLDFIESQAEKTERAHAILSDLLWHLERDKIDRQHVCVLASIVDDFVLESGKEMDAEVRRCMEERRNG